MRTNPKHRPPWGTTELESATYWLKEEREWVERQGPTLYDYIRRYGTAKDPENMSGDGGEAIYAADMAALKRAQERYNAAVLRAAARARRI